jgi:oligopeptide/dipeptide ABC transporter ATP-binding protein
MSTKPILKVHNLKVYYPVRKGFINFGEPQFLKAVDGVSFELYPGEVLGLVGESGCGKSSLGKALLRLQEPTSGKIELGDSDFLNLQGESLRKIRPQIQMIFQDPYASLDPRMTVEATLKEPLEAHQLWDKNEGPKALNQILDRVGISNKALQKYPHEFSGGQRQRIAIARALVLKPKVIVADEPVSSLDVSVQAQVLNLLKEIQKEFNLSMVFISHNLAVVKYIADKIAVMYLGKIVETGATNELYSHCQHPYTQALISAVPIPDPKIERGRKRIELRGELPSPINPPRGCTFHTRCPIAKDSCKISPPELKPYQRESWQVSCFEVK